MQINLYIPRQWNREVENPLLGNQRKLLHLVETEASNGRGSSGASEFPTAAWLGVEVDDLCETLVEQVQKIKSKNKMYFKLNHLESSFNPSVLNCIID